MASRSDPPAQSLADSPAEARPDAAARFAALPDAVPPEEYNFAHFRTAHLVQDGRRAIGRGGVAPGEMAPDFALPRADGDGVTRLSALRGQVVLLHFGSFTSPATAGSVEPLKRLHATFGDRIEFLDVLIRQAHPGPRARPYTTPGEKRRDAERFQRAERIPYPVLVDDLAGTTHQVYGGLADPTYLIGRDGRVAFYAMWTHGPTLHAALTTLLAEGGSGVVRGGIDRVPHLLAPVAAGWRALRRGLPQSFTELELAAPGTASAIWLGDKLRPLLAPAALRSEPLPPTTKLGFALGAGLLLGLLARRGPRGGPR